MRRDVRSVGGGEVASAEPLYASASLVVEPSVPAAISLPRGRLKDGSRASASLRTIDVRGTAPTDTVNVYKAWASGPAPSTSWRPCPRSPPSCRAGQAGRTR